MLQIRLSKVPTLEGGGGTNPLPVDTVTVAYPDHLVLADLAVAKGLGSATAVSCVKSVGRRSRRQLGERVHFCVRCDFPIAIYGRLGPCEHAFCLDCARSDSSCYLCDTHIQKIQTIKIMEGIFICAAPHCLKSFLKKNEFEYHIRETHASLLHSNTEKDLNESGAVSAKKPAASDSTAQAPPRSGFSPSPNSQVHEDDEKTHHPQPRDQPPPWPVIQPNPAIPFLGEIPNHRTEPQPDSNLSQGLDRPVPLNHFPQQNFDAQGGLWQESGQFPDKQQGILSETPYPECPLPSHQPPNFAVPVHTNSVILPRPFGYPPFAPDGAQHFYGASFEMAQPDSVPEARSEQGSLLGFPPGPAGGMNFESCPRPWNMGLVSTPFEPPHGSQGIVDGLSNMPDPQGRIALFQGDYGRNPGRPSNPTPHSTNEGTDPVQGENAMDYRDGKRILAPLPFSLPPPLPPVHPHVSQHKRGKFYSSDMGQDGQGFGWQHDKRDSFGSGREH